MSNQSTDLDQTKRKQLIKEYLQKLTKTDPTLYYSSTTDIAHSLHLMIKEHANRMSVEDYALLKKLSVRDIETLLSFH